MLSDEADEATSEKGTKNTKILAMKARYPNLSALIKPVCMPSLAAGTKVNYVVGDFSVVKSLAT